jgi:dihydroxyacid dehydratase/phosphogluconate dehydratase
MAMVSEALGLSVPNVSMIPGVYAARAAYARRAGALVSAARKRIEQDLSFERRVKALDDIYQTLMELP